MSPDMPAFAAWQADFAARVRDPRSAPRPAGATARRMRVYQDLLFNNLEGFLLACYPVTRRLLGARAWRRGVRAFFREHRCHSPMFRDIPKAFLDWLTPRADELHPAMPWLAELMHYEWLELAVSIAPEEIADAAVDPEGALLAGRPAVNPTARLACYHYPVHRIGPRFRPIEADGATHCYLLFRDRSDTVRFVLLNPLSARLVTMLRDRRPSGREALAHLAGQTAPTLYETYLAAGADLLAGLRAQGALLGTWREP